MCGSTHPKPSRSNSSSRASCAPRAVTATSWSPAPPGCRLSPSPIASPTPSAPRRSPRRGRDPDLHLGRGAFRGRACRRGRDRIAPPASRSRAGSPRRAVARARGSARAGPDGIVLRGRVRRSAREDPRALPPAEPDQAVVRRKALRSGDPRRLPRLSPPCRSGRCRRWHSRAVLHRAADVGVGAEARSMLGLDPGRQTLGLFPGSREQEVKRHWTMFREAAARVAAARPDLQIVVAATAGADYPDPGDIKLHLGDPLLVFAAADAGICKSGTTTLEAAIADVPMVITYRVHPITSYIAFRLVNVPWVGLVNLVAGYEVAPEFLQGRASAETLADGVLPLLDAANPVTRRQREGLQLVRDRLGAPGAADRVAELAAGLIK